MTTLDDEGVKPVESGDETFVDSLFSRAASSAESRSACQRAAIERAASRASSDAARPHESLLYTTARACTVPAMRTTGTPSTPSPSASSSLFASSTAFVASHRGAHRNSARPSERQPRSATTTEHAGSITSPSTTTLDRMILLCSPTNARSTLDRRSPRTATLTSKSYLASTVTKFFNRSPQSPTSILARLIPRRHVSRFVARSIARMIKSSSPLSLPSSMTEASSAARATSERNPRSVVSASLSSPSNPHANTPSTRVPPGSARASCRACSAHQSTSTVRSVCASDPPSSGGAGTSA